MVVRPHSTQGDACDDVTQDSKGVLWFAKNGLLAVSSLCTTQQNVSNRQY
jgi:hypothetical protein